VSGISAPPQDTLSSGCPQADRTST